ncbi:hypothetical protein MA16_Dca010516 [Dendrobium catenatum]|uniref:Uncharacterized protein n=1 Tax=Dendrobium catenatum TaxID=906689 RepID=A0A2I0XF03_9ASPA|nr:hypothetical protein MA16_Dca010516 [Dendrobium catenatum]
MRRQLLHLFLHLPRSASTLSWISWWSDSTSGRLTLRSLDILQRYISDVELLVLEKFVMNLFGDLEILWLKGYVNCKLASLPNRGIIFDVGSARSTGKTSNEIQHDIERMDYSTQMDDLVKGFVLYLLSNIFYPMANFCIPASILEVVENVDSFIMYNWPESIRNFLVHEFNSVATKKANGAALGYVNGFVMIVTINDQSRSRFTRWDGNFMYNEKEVNSIFAELQDHEILQHLRGITDAEKALLNRPSNNLSKSPTLSPPSPASPVNVSTPFKVASPPKDDSSTPNPASLPKVASPRFNDSSAQTEAESSPFTEETNLKILNQAIYELFNKDKFMKEKVASVEETNRILENHVLNLEQSILELKDENFDLKEEIIRKDRVMLHPTDDEEFDPSLETGIAKRVQQRNDRKMKVVSTPFTTGLRKKKTKEDCSSKEKLTKIIPSDVPLQSPETSTATTPPPPTAPIPTQSPVLDPAPTIAPTVHVPTDESVLPTEVSRVLSPAHTQNKEPEPVHVPPASMDEANVAYDKSIIIYEVDDAKEIELRPASEELNYPGRTLLTGDKCIFIDN